MMSQLSDIKQKINDLQNVSPSQIDYGYLPPDNSTTYHAHVLLGFLPIPPYVSSDADGSICFDYEIDGKELELYFKIVGDECHYSYLWCPEEEDSETWVEKEFVGDIRDDKLLVELFRLYKESSNGKS